MKINWSNKIQTRSNYLTVCHKYDRILLLCKTTTSSSRCLTMAYTLPERNHISPLNVLLRTISSQVSRENIRRIKVQLHGHVSKEHLSKLKDGFDLIHILQNCGLVTEKKLSFLRKLLQDCGLFSLMELLDEYKQAHEAMTGECKEGNLYISQVPFVVESPSSLTFIR